MRLEDFDIWESITDSMELLKIVGGMLFKVVDLLEGLVMELTAFINDFEEGRDSYVRQKYFIFSWVVAIIGLFFTCNFSTKFICLLRVEINCNLMT